MQIWLGGNGSNEYICYANSVEEITDGYHTFGELYDHRHVLVSHLLTNNKHIAFKTRRDYEGREWEGWFIGGLNTEYGQISYHMPIEPFWNLLDIPEIERNVEFDGHSSQDVFFRLVRLLQPSQRGSIPVEE